MTQPINISTPNSLLETEMLRFMAFDSPVPLLNNPFEERFESLLNHINSSHPCIISFYLSLLQE